VHIVILGAGAIGSVYGAKLSTAHDVVVVARPAHADAIARDGLRITGTEDRLYRVRAVTRLDSLPPNALIVLTTKVFHSTTGTPGDTGLAPDRIRRQLESSLERLGVDRIDLYLAHEPDPETPLAETIATFEQVLGEGLIGAWGLSNYDLAGLEEAVRHGRPALLQNSFSLLDRGDEPDVQPFCAAQGISYVAFSPLAGGWLTGKYRRGEPFPAGSRMTLRPGPYEQLVDERVFDGLDRLRAEAETRGVDLPALAFAWVLARVDGAVCGPNRAGQLDPVLAARELRLSDDDVDRIGRFFQ